MSVAIDKMHVANSMGDTFEASSVPAEMVGHCIFPGTNTCELLYLGVLSLYF